MLATLDLMYVYGLCVHPGSFSPYGDELLPLLR